MDLSEVEKPQVGDLVYALYDDEVSWYRCLVTNCDEYGDAESGRPTNGQMVTVTYEAYLKENRDKLVDHSENYSFLLVQVPKVKTSISIAVENESDKENSIKPILRNKDDYSKIRFSEPRPDSTLIKKSYSSNRISTCVDEQEMKPRGRLHSANIVINKSEEISKEFNIPLSVKQAKACFESLAQNSHSSVPTPKQTSPKFIKTRVDPVQSSRHPGGFTPVKASIL